MQQQQQHLRLWLSCSGCCVLQPALPVVCHWLVQLWWVAEVQVHHLPSLKVWCQDRHWLLLLLLQDHPPLLLCWLAHPAVVLARQSCACHV